MKKKKNGGTGSFSDTKFCPLSAVMGVSKVEYRLMCAVTKHLLIVYVEQYLFLASKTQLNKS